MKKMYIVIQKIRDQIKKRDQNQDCQGMSRDITLLYKTFEIKMQDQ